MACKTPERFFPVVKTPALPKGSFNGKLALVTGGGTGLGKAMATTLAALGAQVVIAARRLDVLKATANEISSLTKAEVLPVQLDVRNAENVAQAVDQIEQRFGRLPNVVVNNAAGNFIMATERLSPNAIRTVVEIVLLGTVNITTEIGRRLVKNPEKNHGCAFLNISTTYAKTGSAFVVPSAISKAGVDSLVRSLASEWAKYGMRFNAIAPGPIPTEGAFGRLNTMSMDEAVVAAGRTVPAGRCGQPEELANLAAYMCSDYASWMNGSIVDFDGGQQFLITGGTMGREELHAKSPQEWEDIERLIRDRTGKSKDKAKI